MRRFASGVKKADLNLIGEYAELKGYRIGLMDAPNRTAYFVDKDGKSVEVSIGSLEEELNRAEGGPSNGKHTRRRA